MKEVSYGLIGYNFKKISRTHLYGATSIGSVEELKTNHISLVLFWRFTHLFVNSQLIDSFIANKNIFYSNTFH